MIRIIYNLLWPLGLLFFLPGYLLKMLRRGGYREKFGQRLGIYGAEIRTRLTKQRSTWLHAVSVGEVTVALKLAHALRALQPNLHCVLTTTTTTGFALANKSASPWIEVMYTPLDFWPIIRRAFAIIHPARILLVEAEVSPNLVAEAHARRIPIALVNARLSPSSEHTFRLFRLLVAPTFHFSTLFACRNRGRHRWRRLGVRLAGFGTQAASNDHQSWNGSHQTISVSDRMLRSSPCYGGSAIAAKRKFCKDFFKLRRGFSLLCLFIAPRHVERLREIELVRLVATCPAGNRSGHAWSREARMCASRYDWSASKLVPDSDRRLHRKKFDGARRAKSGRTHYKGQTGHLWTAHGEFCGACDVSGCE